MSNQDYRRSADIELDSAESATTRYLHQFVGQLLTMLGADFGGDTTINHLRIGNFIGLKSQHMGEATSNAEIAEALGISRPTVSRIVADFLASGWICDEPHPSDGRKRLLTINPDHPLADHFEKRFRGLLNPLLDRYDAGELVIVDPGRRSFNT